MILLIGKVSVLPDKLEEFFSEVNKAIEATLKEEGVSRYELVQVVGEPNTFMLIEEYADDAAFASHAETEHMKTLGAKLGTMVAGPPEGKIYTVTGAKAL